MSDIEIEIDGQKLTAKPNQTVIQVADEAGIYIPRFCYHKHLSIAANCRMCLVEVEKSPKALPACATPVMPGMKVFTKSPKTIEAQRAVMEFLLINHPLDCPICDQGGECELQDLSMGYGASQSSYDECKRSIADQNLGSLIATDMTRCIFCTRCVRFGDEIAGLREMGVTFRGEHSEVGTYVQEAVKSEVSGNIIDLCPVGALTSKPYRFTARAWELQQAPSISPHDGLGANVNVHTRYGKVMRVISKDNQAINETWISDRDRFSYTGLYHADRLDEPLVKVHGKWEVVEWQKALEIATRGLQDVVAEHGADKLGALASPNSTLEEFYLLQKIMRGLGSPHIDYRLREIDTRDQAEFAAFPGLSISIDAIEKSDSILLIGSNLQKEYPLLALRARKAIKNGAVISAINPVDYAFNFTVSAKKIVSPSAIAHTLVQLIKALESSSSDADIQAIANQLKDKKQITIFVGAFAMHHPDASTIRKLSRKMAELTGASINFLTDGANAAGAWLAGCIPHRCVGGEAINHAGLSAYEMLAKPRKGYVLLNVEPDLDTANSAHAIEAMKHAKFVVALSSYRNSVLDEHADVILPVAAFTETSGTYVNLCGEWQGFQGVANAYGSARPAWKVLRVLGNFLHLEEFDYDDSQSIHREIKKHQHKINELTMPAVTIDFSTASEHHNLFRIGEVPIYAVDALTRRATPLQMAQAAIEGDVNGVRIHPETAKKLNLQAGQSVRIKQASMVATLPWVADERIAKEAVWIAGGIAATAMLGDLFGEVEITSC